MVQRLTRPDAWPRTALRLGLRAASIFIVAHVFTRYVGSIGSTHGISMLPTIPAGYRESPWILYSSLHKRGRWIKVGDVITYKHPMLPNTDGAKRVIGMPGDFVAVVTPGKREDDMGKRDSEGEWAVVREKMVQVPEGHCWLAGDNLDWSRDSRLFGPVPLGLVKAKVLAVWWPLRDAKWVGGDRDVLEVRDGGHEWVKK